MSFANAVSLLFCFLSIVEILGQGIGNFDFGQELILSDHGDIGGAHLIDGLSGGADISPVRNVMVRSRGNVYTSPSGRSDLSAPRPTTRTIRVTRTSTRSYPESVGRTRRNQYSGNSRGGGLDLSGLLRRMTSLPGQSSFSWTIRSLPQRTTQRRQQVRLQRIPDVFQSFGSNGFDIFNQNPRRTFQPRVNRGHSVIPALPPTSGTGKASSEYGLTQGHIQHLLTAHNNARRELGAADMHHMRWDKQLASEAHSWIQRCVMEHQGVRGENLAMVAGSIMNIDSLVDYGINGWYNEKNKWTYGDAFSPATGHYTQMIWSSTTHVGCAAKRCPDMYLLACFYSPPGNVMGFNPYTRGAPCSMCHGGCQNNLCVSAPINIAAADVSMDLERHNI
ncbi:uncharacterized protein [Haliotis asinina]|uniref:uncharacterized protein n=1 Tax=Haliotis asinina TaxID=109174 RepID=UPI003532022F